MQGCMRVAGLVIAWVVLVILVSVFLNIGLIVLGLYRALNGFVPFVAAALVSFVYWLVAYDRRQRRATAAGHAPPEGE